MLSTYTDKHTISCGEAAVHPIFDKHADGWHKLIVVERDEVVEH